MNNEETIVMKPQNNNNKAEKTQNVEIAEKESNKGKKVAATAAAAVMGGVVVSGATYAATTMLHDKEAEEQKPEDEAQTTEESVVAAAEEPQKEQQTEAPKEEEVAVKLDAAESAEPDYTGAHHADPVTPNPEVHAAVDETSNSDTNEVQVLGVYEAQGENGQTMQAAVLTNGEDVAAVIDVDGDGVANVLVVDENHNQQIDEGEVYDLSNDHVQMSDYQDAYLAQQQEQMQQEHDTFAYNASDDQQDYNNDVDPQYV